MNAPKSLFFIVDNSITFNGRIKSVIGCNSGSISFKYLGVPTFVGAPKFRYLQPLVDKVKSKLASWKGKVLSMMRMVHLVNLVIFGFMAYNFQIYK